MTRFLRAHAFCDVFGNLLVEMKLQFIVEMRVGLIAPEEHSAAGSQVATSQSIAARVEELMHQAKLDRKEALKVAAKERGLTRRAAYGQLVEEQDLEDKNKKD